MRRERPARAQSMRRRGCASTASTARRATVASSTAACPPTATGPIASPSCCRARRLGTTPARTASGRCACTRDRMPLATTSSSRVGSPRPLWEWEPGRATAKRPWSHGSGHAGCAQTPRRARCARRATGSSSETGSKSSRRSSSSPTVPMPGRRQAHSCCSRCATRTPGAFGSPSGSSARLALRAAGRSSGASRRSPTHPRPTGRGSCAPWRRLRRAWSATTTTASTEPCARPSPTRSSISASGTCVTRSSG